MIGSSWERGESHLVFLHQDLFKQDFFFFFSSHRDQKAWQHCHFLTHDYTETSTAFFLRQPAPFTEEYWEMQSKHPELTQLIWTFLVVVVYLLLLTVSLSSARQTTKTEYCDMIQHENMLNSHLCFRFIYSRLKRKMIHRPGPLIGQFWWCHVLEAGLCLFHLSCSVAMSCLFPVYPSAKLKNIISTFDSFCGGYDAKRNISAVLQSLLSQCKLSLAVHHVMSVHSLATVSN